MGLGLIPVVGLAKDLYEGLIGESLLTGRTLSKNERMLTLALAATLGLGSTIAGLKAIGNVAAGSLPFEKAAIDNILSSAGKLLDEVKVEGAEDTNILNADQKPGYVPPYKSDSIAITASTEPNFQETYQTYPKEITDSQWSSTINPAEVGQQEYATQSDLPLKRVVNVDGIKFKPGSKIRISVPSSGKGIQIENRGPRTNMIRKRIGRFENGIFKKKE